MFISLEDQLTEKSDELKSLGFTGDIVVWVHRNSCCPEAISDTYRYSWTAFGDFCGVRHQFSGYSWEEIMKLARVAISQISERRETELVSLTVQQRYDILRDRGITGDIDLAPRRARLEGDGYVWTDIALRYGPSDDRRYIEAATWPELLDKVESLT